MSIGQQGRLFSDGPSLFPLRQDHPDHDLLAPIASALVAAAGGEERFGLCIPPLFRQAIDEVIDAPRTNRFTIDEIEKTEKTYLGTKVEILLRNFLGLPKGNKLDLLVDGHEVDIKNTMLRNWTIPLESHGLPALLLRANEKSSLCDVGLILVREAYLNPGKNRDAKRTIAAEAFQNIWWLLYQAPYPPNFWEILAPQERHAIMASGKGSARLASLFELLQRKPISRLQIEAIAQQRDYMKRLRRNGGARDALVAKGIALLWGTRDKELIERLDLGPVGPDEFISIAPQNAQEAELLREALSA